MTDRENDEDRIRALIDEKVRAVRAKDVRAALAHYAADVATFDVVDPLRHAGVDAVAERLETWLSTFEGPVGFEVRDLSISVGGDVAFCHGLSHVSATTKDGGTLDMWWRATTGFRRTGGRWMVTHEHSSVPFDPDTGRASLGLKP